MSARIKESPRLIALLDGERVGGVYQERTGRFRFVYDDDWRRRADAYPLSLSMPLAAAEHAHDAINAYLLGLLPDNPAILDQYARMFSVSAANPVSLLTHLGADCAGAVQFASPDKVDQLVGSARSSSGIEWLTDEQIARDLSNIRRDRVRVPGARSNGQFSLAGAQPKIALLEENGRWGRPSGRVPTNRILKPPTGTHAGFAENEHLCLELASAIGLGAVRSRVRYFGDEIAIIVDRFDRMKSDRTYRRVHQEDVCQALSVVPTRKYQNEGGPGVEDIVTLIRDSSIAAQEDVTRFISAIAFTWVVAATDGHAKNYALLHARGGTTRLAPFYDIASYLPYADEPLHNVKLAMKVGADYLVKRISARQWIALSAPIGVPRGQVIENVARVAESCAAMVDEVCARALDDGLDETIVRPLAKRIRERAHRFVEGLIRRS